MWGNESFAEDVPVRVPAPTVQIVPEDTDDQPETHTSSISGATTDDESGDDSDDGAESGVGPGGPKPSPAATTAPRPGSTQTAVEIDESDDESRDGLAGETHSDDTPAGEPTAER